MSKAAARLIFACYTTILCVLIFAVHLLFEQSKKTELKIAELENTVKIKDAELEYKVEREMVIYEQLFTAYTNGVRGEW